MDQTLTTVSDGITQSFSFGLHQAGVPFFVLFLVAGLIATAFWFFTNELFSIKVSTGIWWFYLLLCTGLLFFAASYLLRFVDRGTVQTGCLIATAGLVVAVVVLGIFHRPFKTENIKRRIGLVPAFSGSDGYPTEKVEEKDFTPVTQSLNQEDLLGAPVDQGYCGSCWAVASATVMSARYNKYLIDNGKSLPYAGAFTCSPAGVDMRYWHASPQYLLDSDVFTGNGKECSAESGGRCNGNTQLAGFELATAGVPNAQCVPYFVVSGNQTSCNKNCGAPQSNYLSCPSGKTTMQCIKDPGVRWSNCADGKKMAKTMETYDVKHVVGELAMIKEIEMYGPILCGINYYEKANKAGAAWTLSDDGYLGNYAGLTTPGYISRPDMDGKEYTKSFDKGGGHALVVYGYGELNGVKYWNVRNSWGPQWGVNGTSKVERGIDAWNIEQFCASAKVRPYSGG